MSFVQLLALAFAVFATALFVRRVVVQRNFSFGVQFCLGIPIPLAALLMSLFVPESVWYLTDFAVAGACLFGAAVFLAYFPWRAATATQPDHVWTQSELSGSRSRWLAARALGLAGITTIVFSIEPAFGLANAALIVVWVAIWIPRPLRTFHAESSVDIRASPAALWDLMIDPDRIPRADDLVEVVVEPPGRYRLGTRVTAVQRRPLVRTWRGRTDILIRTASVVTELVEGRSYTVVSQGNMTWTTRQVEPSGQGSRVTMKSWFMASVIQGIAGAALDYRSGLVVYRRKADESLALLRDAAEGAA